MWFTLQSLRPDSLGQTAGSILLRFSLTRKSGETDVGQMWNRLISALEGEDLLNPSFPGTLESVSLISGDEGESSEGEGLEGLEEDEEGSVGDIESVESDLEVEDINDVDGDLEIESDLEDLEQSEGTPTIQVTQAPSRKKRTSRRAKRKKKPRSYEFNTQSNVVGVTFLDLVKVNDLPPERNVTRMGFDMDPFVVVTFGKKVFRTPWKRHTLNPVFNEKMLFPVQKHEQNFSINFTVMDKDRFSLNDFVADCDLSIQELLNTAPPADPETGLFSPKDLMSLPVEQEPSKKKKTRLGSIRRFKSKNGTSSQNTPAHTMPVTPAESETSSSSNSNNNDLDLKNLVINTDEQQDFFGDTGSTIDVKEHKEFTLPLKLKNLSKWESKYSPEIIIRGRFLPYAALRQYFWRGLIRIYDADDTETINYIELTTMLDSLGSTLSKKTKESFFNRFDKDSEEEELTFDEVVICLEDQILKDSVQESNNNNNNNNNGNESADPESDLELGKSNDTLDSLSEDENGKVSERVLQINTCPVCNQPRLGKRTEIDIVTHLATCASQNWAQVDTLVMDRYVTSNQARKRWYSKVVSKVSYGNYKLGANSANILVQDRVTGYVLEEKMSVYVRLGIRLLYKGIRSQRRMETKRIRNLLRSMSIKQGKKYDSPSSVHNIIPFIKFHNLYMEDVLEPIENFKSFNEFFYRKLKPKARPCDAADNSKISVSPADCRSTVFESIDQATEIWVKGREFSIKRLFGDAYPEMVDMFINGSMAIYRLAPQDYHRFHCPVDGNLGEPKQIEGEYYTVNPMAIRSSLDVYGENVRVLVPIESEEFGTVMFVCVGAMMVGSTIITAEKDKTIKRTDEVGYFAFGGSTILVFYQPGKIKFDEDLVENSKGALETLVRVGMSVGHAPDEPEYERHDLRQPKLASEEQKKWAHRIITGSELKDEDEKMIHMLNDDV